MTPFRRCAVVVGVVAAFVAAALATCQPPVESPAGLLITAGGSLYRLGDAGSLDPVGGAPANARHVAAAGRSIVVLTEDDRLVAAAAPSGKADGLAWRPIEVRLPVPGFTAGIDVSPDGRSLALVRAHDDANHLELLDVDLRTGTTRTRALAQGGNGPPSWLGNDALALEVVDDDGIAKVVSVAAPGGDGDGAAPVESASRGLALAATPDGRTLAVADGAARSVVVVPRAAWWSGGSSGATIEPPSPDLAVQDVAIDADGTRLAVVYARGDSARWTLVVSTLANGGWQRATSIDLDSDAPPTIDWLE